jgi:hypothetical protein
MYLADFLHLRPTHIEQKIGNTHISLLPLHIVSKLQTFKIPILKSQNLEELQAWFWAAKISSTVIGISLNVSNEELLSQAEDVLKKLMIFLNENRIDIPFFIEAEITLADLEKNPETVFYYLLQSYFTSFNLKINISNYKNEIEALNQIYKPIRDLELGFTLNIDSDTKDILKNIDEFFKTLSVFKISPNYIIVKDNDYSLKNLIKEKIDVKLSENASSFNNFSSNIYVESKLLKTTLNENIENQVFYSSTKFFNGIDIKNTISKMLNNLYKVGDEL